MVKNIQRNRPTNDKRFKAAVWLEENWAWIEEHHPPYELVSAKIEEALGCSFTGKNVAYLVKHWLRDENGQPRVWPRPKGQQREPGGHSLRGHNLRELARMVKQLIINSNAVLHAIGPTEADLVLLEKDGYVTLDPDIASAIANGRSNDEVKEAILSIRKTNGAR